MFFCGKFICLFYFPCRCDCRQETYCISQRWFENAKKKDMRKEKWVLVGDSHEIVADVVEKKMFNQ